MFKVNDLVKFKEEFKPDKNSIFYKYRDSKWRIGKIVDKEVMLINPDYGSWTLLEHIEKV